MTNDDITLKKHKRPHRTPNRETANASGANLEPTRPLFQPYPGNQSLAMGLVGPGSDCQELLLGSVLGTGKSLLLLMAPLHYIQLPHFNCIILRSSWPELEQGLIPTSKEYYTTLGAKYHGGNNTWTFPSGAVITFGFLESIDDIRRYRGIQRQMICYDELSSFSEEVYTYMNAWLRPPGLYKIPSGLGFPFDALAGKDYPLHIISTANPGGKHGDWILERWKYWLSEKHVLPEHRLKGGQIIKVRDPEDPGISITRSCVKLSAEDNPSIDRKKYNAQFIGMSPTLKKQLKGGNWDARPAGAEYFDRRKLTIVPVPMPGRRVIAWDLAASTSKKADYTAWILMAKHADGTYTIEDYARKRKNPADVEAYILEIANKNPGIKQIIPVDPGQAGIAQKLHLARLLDGHKYEFYTTTLKTKFERAKPVSAACLTGNGHVKIIVSDYYTDLMDELEAFTSNPKDYLHDDFVDCLSAAHTALLRPRIEMRTEQELGGLDPFQRVFGKKDTSNDGGIW